MRAPAALSHTEVDDALEASSFVRHGDEIELIRTFPSFPEALGFVTAVGALAETQNHHPDIDIRWTTVTLRVTTHQINGLSERDVALARSVDALF
jgi:4a-hydroxytetrahydrobiopterin dehydratase